MIQKIHLSRFFVNVIIPDMIEWSKQTGHKIYIVGGACRDLLRDEVVNDVDFCIESPQGAMPFVDYLKSKEDPQTGKNKYEISIVSNFKNIGTVIISIGTSTRRPLQIEIAMTRKEIYNGNVRIPEKVEFAPIQEDAKRRDFCCNAVYFDLITEKYIDPTGKGISDAKNGILRTVKDPEISFKEDPLRMIRCIRFWHTKRYLGYKIEEKTEAAIHMYPEYDKLSVELIKPEFEKILLSATRTGKLTGDDKSSSIIWYLHDRGLLKKIIPEFEEAWGFNQNSKYHSMNLTDHLLATLDWVQLMCFHKAYFKIDERIVSYAALLHDISKYKTYQLKKDNTFSFHDHETTSGDMAEKILRRLGYDKEFSGNVGQVIKCHMLLKPFWDPISKKYEATDKITQRLWELLFERSNKHFGEALCLIDADNNTHAPDKCRSNQVEQFKARYHELFPNIIAQQFQGSLPELPDGDMIRDALNISKEDSRLIGQITSVLKEIVPLQNNYRYLTKDDILNIYLGMFDMTFYVRSVHDITDDQLIVYPFNPFDPKKIDEEANLAFEDIDSFDRARINKLFEQPDKLIDVDILREQVSAEGRALHFKTNDTKYVAKINAIYFPLIYMEYQLRKQVEESCKKIKEGIRAIVSLPGYSCLNIDDRDGDTTSIVEFRNGKRIISL